MTSAIFFTTSPYSVPNQIHATSLPLVRFWPIPPPPCRRHLNMPPFRVFISNPFFSKGWSDIGYSFLIGGDGRVYEGRGWGRVGAHTYGYNSRAYGIRCKAYSSPILEPNKQTPF